MFSLTTLLLLAWTGGVTIVLMEGPTATINEFNKFRKNPANLAVIGSIALFVIGVGIFATLVTGTSIS